MREGRVRPPDALINVATLNEVLAKRVLLSGEGSWLTLYDRDRIAATTTFRALADSAAIWAGALSEAGVRPGDRVVMVLPTEPAFYEAYWGILLAGAAPVPAYPPVKMSRLDEYRETLARQIANCRAAAMVTNERLLPLVRPAAPVRTPVVIPSGAKSARPLDPVAVSPSALGLLQYTSGSTGSQKGVMLSHGNLVANLRAIGAGAGLGPDDVAVSWLPLYHDMGLIGLMLASVYWGIPLIAASPVDFLRRPSRWLHMISRHGGTVTAGPNFAYNLVARKLKDEEINTLDLRTWRVALCGAEPIHPATVDNFTRRFAPAAFRPETFFPAYGLAENTLAVTFSDLDALPVMTALDSAKLENTDVAERLPVAEGGKLFVSVGRPVPSVEVAIMDSRGGLLPEARRGEVVIRGPSLTAGYFENEEATRETIIDGWLHTGDLGFRLEGLYYICGRKKDMVIKAGRNYFAEDIETAALVVDGVRPGGLCVFSVEDPVRGTEEVVLVAEVREKRSGLEDEIKLAVSDTTGCRPDRVVLVEPRTVPKTSSGKIQRFMAKKWYLDGSLGQRQGERRTTAWWIYLKEMIKDKLGLARSK